MLKAAIAALALCLAASAVYAQPSADLARIIADFETFDRANDPLTSGAEGDRAALSRLPDVTPQADAARLTALKAFKARLEAVAPEGLSDEERFNEAFLARVVDNRIERAAFDEARLAFDSEGGPATTLLYVAGDTVIRSRADADAYLERLRAAPKFIDDTTANARRGIAAGFTQPRVTVETILPQLKAELATPADADPLLKPFEHLPAIIPPAEQAALQTAARTLVTDGIRSAEMRFEQMVEREYLPHARESLAARSLPDGAAYYAWLARHYTTTPMTPDEIHALGLSEVARIRAEMDAVIVESGFKGSFAEFLHFLRTDPQFYATSRQDLMEKASEIAKRIDDKLPGEFGTLPRLTYGVREVPRALEENYTTGRYNPGSPKLGVAGGYMVNTSHLDQRPLYELPSLTLHESVPGHHLQIALSQELGEQPWFRRNANLDAFSEGWGLYAEYLGGEMGIYRTPYERFGKLSYEMWRACRLVADTGLHWKGWSIEQARACFRDNSALAPHNIETELQRYISWPGQALAYKVGELKLRELRKRAETQLGPDFDVRAFHDAVLLGGAMPLDLLDQRIDAWIARTKAKAAP